jgi:hypothetical protein
MDDGQRAPDGRQRSQIDLRQIEGWSTTTAKKENQMPKNAIHLVAATLVAFALADVPQVVRSAEAGEIAA